jgi:hypothetical protein
VVERGRVVVTVLVRVLTVLRSAERLGVSETASESKESPAGLGKAKYVQCTY